jgi:hypothetical protein
MAVDDVMAHLAAIGWVILGLILIGAAATGMALLRGEVRLSR